MYSGQPVAFLFFEQNAIYITILFLCSLVDKILQTSSVAEKLAAAAVQEHKAVSDRFKWCMKMIPGSDGQKW